MKSIKLAMILLVGQCVFNPLAALSNPIERSPALIASTQRLVEVSSEIRTTCIDLSARGMTNNLAIVDACAHVGVNVDGTNLSYKFSAINQQIVDASNRLRTECLGLSEGMGTDNSEVIHACASVGVGVDNTNKD
jgi:hypothetical protein